MRLRAVWAQKTVLVRLRAVKNRDFWVIFEPRMGAPAAPLIDKFYESPIDRFYEYHF